MAYSSAGTSFRWLDSRMGEADQPLSTRYLLDRLNNLRHHGANRGSRCSISFPGAAYGNLSLVGYRPYAALTWSAVMLIPVMIQPGIDHFDVSLLVRTGHGGKDNVAADFKVPADWTVDIRAYLMDHSDAPELVGHGVASPESGDNTKWVKKSIEVPVERGGDIYYPIWDLLVVEQRSQFDRDNDVSTYTEDFTSGIYGIMVDLGDGTVGTDTWYADDTAASSPQYDSNWITCTEASNGTWASASPVTPHEHAFALTSQQMVIAPALDMRAGAFGTTVKKRYVPYLQVRAIEIAEAYTDQVSGAVWKGGVDSSKFAALNDVGSVGLSAMALDELAIYRRREMVVGGMWTLLDNDAQSTNPWFSRTFGLKPFVHGRISASSTMTFANVSPATITRSTGSWLDEGFSIGEQIVVSGTASNDGTYLLHPTTEPTATVLTLAVAESLTAESIVTTITRSGRRAFSAAGSTRIATPRFTAQIVVIGAHIVLGDTLLMARLNALPMINGRIQIPTELSEYTIESAVEIVVDISQAGTTVATATLTDQVIDLYPATADPASRHLQAVNFAMQDTAGADIALRLGTTDINLNEGIDSALVRAITVAVPLTGSFDDTEPLTATITIAQIEARIAATDYPRWSDNATSIPDRDIAMQKLRVDVVGLSIYAADNS